MDTNPMSINKPAMESWHHGVEHFPWLISVVSNTTEGLVVTGEIEYPPGVDICFDGVSVERGQVGDFVMVWKDRGEIKHYLLRDGSSCRMGGGNVVGFSWSSSLGWSGRLKVAEGLLSLTTNRPGLVLDLGTGEGSSSGPTVFRMQTGSFRVMGTAFYCTRVCFSPSEGFLWGIGY